MVIEHIQNKDKNTQMPKLNITLKSNELTDADKVFLQTNIEQLLFEKKLGSVNVILFTNNFKVPDDLREALENKSYSVYPLKNNKDGEGYIRIKIPNLL